MTEFRVLQADTDADRSQWISRLEEWPDHEVFCHPDYLRLFVPAGGRAAAACLTAGKGAGVLYPFVVRSLRSEPWVRGQDDLYDIIGPYGYGGAFCWGDLSADATSAFWSRFEEWCAGENVVSSFARLSLFESQTIPFKGEVGVISQNVVRSLDLSPDEIWMDYAHKVRKNVKRARSAGAVAEQVASSDGLPHFIDIYGQTMERRSALSEYKFEDEFFERLVTELENYVALFQVRHDDRVVSSEMVLTSKNHIYSFLGGTLESGFPVRANDLLKHHIVTWGQDHGKSAFVLGGGYQPDDGIFNYKRTFAPSGVVPFRTGKATHDPTACEDLIRMRVSWEEAQGRAAWEPKASFFPSYRSP